MRQQGVDEAMGIRTERQAEEGATGSQLVAASLRSEGVGVTEGSFTSGTRAEKATTTGSVLGDLFHETDTGWVWRWNGTAWLFVTGLYVAADAARAALTVSAADNGVLFYASDTGILWKVEAGAWANKFTRLEVTADLKVNGNKVVGARGTTVADVASADATDLASALTLVNELKAQVNTAFSRLRSTTGHGLWT